jgi:tyrosyl-tRNA synthetase
LTTPLILIGGKKMSKSEGSAVWLDPEMTSPYAFYQYWMNATDDQVSQLLRYYTFLSLDEVADLESATAANPAERAAHRTLAWEVTSLVHGEDAAKSARKASEVLFTAEVAELDEETFLAAMSDAPRTEMSKGDFEASSVSRLLEVTGLSKSLSEARRDVSSGGAYVNNERSVVDEAIAPSKLLHGRFLVIRKGKKNYHLIEVK